MQLLTSLLYCLLALVGCHERAGTTIITRATEGGADTFFSKTVASPDTARFHCLASSSGRCHYLVYEPQCDGAAATTACARHELERFDLAVGQERELQGLAVGFRQCAGAAGDDLRPGC